MESKRQSDVYVFALLKHKDKQTVDPLNVKQWDFHVVPTKALDNYDRSEVSITYSLMPQCGGGRGGLGESTINSSAGAAGCLRCHNW